MSSLTDSHSLADIHGKFSHEDDCDQQGEGYHFIPLMTGLEGLDKPFTIKELENMWNDAMDRDGSKRDGDECSIKCHKFTEPSKIAVEVVWTCVGTPKQPKHFHEDWVNIDISELRKTEIDEFGLGRTMTLAELLHQYFSNTNNISRANEDIRMQQICDGKFNPIGVTVINPGDSNGERQPEAQYIPYEPDKRAGTELYELVEDSDHPNDETSSSKGSQSGKHFTETLLPDEDKPTKSADEPSMILTIPWRLGCLTRRGEIYRPDVYWQREEEIWREEQDRMRTRPEQRWRRQGYRSDEESGARPSFRRRSTADPTGGGYAQDFYESAQTREPGFRASRRPRRSSREGRRPDRRSEYTQDHPASPPPPRRRAPPRRADTYTFDTSNTSRPQQSSGRFRRRGSYGADPYDIPETECDCQECYDIRHQNPASDPRKHPSYTDHNTPPPRPDFTRDYYLSDDEGRRDRTFPPRDHSWINDEDGGDYHEYPLPRFTVPPDTDTEAEVHPRKHNRHSKDEKKQPHRSSRHHERPRNSERKDHYSKEKTRGSKNDSKKSSNNDNDEAREPKLRGTHKKVYGGKKKERHHTKQPEEEELNHSPTPKPKAEKPKTKKNTHHKDRHHRHGQDSRHRHYSHYGPTVPESGPSNAAQYHQPAYGTAEWDEQYGFVYRSY